MSAKRVAAAAASTAADAGRRAMIGLLPAEFVFGERHDALLLAHEMPDRPLLGRAGASLDEYAAHENGGRRRLGAHVGGERRAERADGRRRRARLCWRRERR